MQNIRSELPEIDQWVGSYGYLPLCILGAEELLLKSTAFNIALRFLQHQTRQLLKISFDTQQSRQHFPPALKQSAQQLQGNRLIKRPYNC